MILFQPVTVKGSMPLYKISPLAKYHHFAIQIISFKFKTLPLA